METVQIIISDGAVQHVDAPKGIRVVIRDYDVQDTSEDTGFDIRQDENGDIFQHMEFIADEGDDS